MPQPPHNTDAAGPLAQRVERVRAVGLLAVTLLTFALAGRAVWLLAASAYGAGLADRTAPEPTPSAQQEADQVAGKPTAPQQKRLTEEEVAMLGGLCPTALSAIPPEWLPPSVREDAPAEPTAVGPRARITGLRLASRGRRLPSAAEPVRVAQAPTATEPTPTQRSDGWLVSPEAWYAPEDAAGEADEPSPPEASAPIEPSAPPPLEPAEPPVQPAFEPPTAALSTPEPSAPEPPTEPPASPTMSQAERALRDAMKALGAAEPAEERAAPSEVEVTPPTLTVAPAEPVETPREPYEAPQREEASPPETVEDEGDSGLSVEPPLRGPSFAPPGVAIPLPEEGEADLDRLVESLAPPPEEPVGVFDAPEAPPAEEETREVEPWEPIEPFQETPVLGTPTPPEPTTDEEPADSSLAAPAPPITPEPVKSEPVKSEPVEPEPVTSEPAREGTAPPARGGLFDAPRTELFAAPPTPAKLTSPHGAGAAAEARAAAKGKSADESHRELFAKNCYPSARECAACHERIYNEWSVSSHAYAFVSPMFHKFENKLSELSQGTVGHFCYRCHSPIATAMGELRSTPVGDLAEVAREGVTCIVCHRVNQRHGKSNGERRIEPGDIYAPVNGGVGGDGVAEVIAQKEKYKVKTSDGEKGPGQAIHAEGRFFDQLTHAEACTSCHQVAVHPGIKLEVVWEQYRASPACKKGVTCQECHMGRVPGMAGGYNYGSIAELNGKTVNDHRKQSSHIFYGPGYSIAHPGVFPQNKDAAKWTLDEWMQFDWRAGWGTDDFEDRVEEAEERGVDTASWFPEVWRDIDDRCDAREVIEENLERLETKRRYREAVMENGSHVDGPFFRETPTTGRDLRFDYVVANKNEGHNLPTASLGAQPQLWANVVLVGPDGRRVWESGYTDSNGDLCDIHSVDVRQGRLPFDKQLFNLQTMFLITGVTGTDREFPLPVNFSFDQVPHLRPGTIPITTTNHPPFIRMESRSIAPLGKKRVKYTVPGELLCRPGRYRLSFRLRSRTEPMYFMRFCEATPEMLRAMTEGTLDIHPYSVEFDVLPDGSGRQVVPIRVGGRTPTEMGVGW